ncbi:Cell surface glycoprotein [uncultured archaeon]|nr:Cell surface glycoprotein [uncultured archaeon]
MRKIGKFSLIGFTTLAILLLASSAGAATLTVNASGGADYTRIQDSIDNASTGDTIYVFPGVYNENVDVNKSVNVVGSGSEVTIVRAFDSNNYVFRVTVDRVNISGFTVTGATGFYYSGILLKGIKYSNISNNNVSGNQIGINLVYDYTSTLVNSSNNILIGNRVSNNIFGINLTSSNNNLLKGNIISNNNMGIDLYYNSNNNTLIDNTAIDNYVGIRIHSSSYNVLVNNIASNNTYGIENNGYFSTDSSDNQIYNNIFNNTNNFYFEGTVYNYWNTTKTLGTNIIGGSDIGGNFWANPSGTGFSQTCKDTDMDGFCDSPYTLDANNTDFLPLAYSIRVQSNSIGYSATVATGQNTYVQSSDGSFGLLLKGQSKIINNSVILNNTGDISAKVEAHFNDSIGGVFGLVSGANVLNATNFALGIPGVLVPQDNGGTDVQVAVAPPGVTALDARLGVPNEQAAGDYSGTVVLTFSNNI